ncbi:MAG: ATP-binding protein [Lachnospiraceae bacterium]|nr:ATP-binding protein [Lachnospiraceae bacterium]
MIERMKKNATKEAIFVYVSSMMVYMMHVIYAFLAYGSKEGLIILGITAACEFLMFGSLFVFKNVEANKRIYFIVAIASCFIIADRLNTVGLVLMVYMGILYQLSIYIDRRVINEAFLMAQLALFVYLKFFYDWSSSNLTQGFFAIQEVLLVCFWIIISNQVIRMREVLTGFEIKTQQAENANISKNTFLANMSHEIRTPLNSIQGMTQLMSDRELSPIEREYINNIQNSSNDLLSLVNNLLDYANIEAGKMEMNNNVYDMGSMIHDICVEVTRKIDTKPISFILDIAPDFPHLLKGDSARVNQILDNVLDNAVKFTKSGTIYMGVRWEEKEGRAHIYIDVTDTGTGIKESDLQKIFDAFSQSDMHRNRRAEGTGLGLSIVKKLVDSMDGDIHIVSRENEGTTVKMDIYQGIDDRFPFINVDVEPNTQVFVYEPNRTYCDNLLKTLKSLNTVPTKIQSFDFVQDHLKDAGKGYVLYDYLRGSEFFEALKDEFPEFTFIAMHNRNVKTSSINTPGITYAQRPITILTLAGLLGKQYSNITYEKKKEFRLFSAPEAKVLVVDDNETNLKVAEGFLRKYDVQVTTVISGYDCIRELGNGSFDIVFMDHMMPNLDGAETTQLIRKSELETGTHQIIVALTANAVKGAEEYLLSCGMDDYMTKPIDNNTLNQIMNKYIPEEYKYDKIETETVSEKIPEEFLVSTNNIDIEKGIQNMGGSKTTYLGILKTAYNEGLKQIKNIREYFEAGDIKSYIITVHAVKSTMLGLGATELSEIAKAHEFAGKDDNISFIKDGIDALVEKFDLVLYEMKQILEREGLIEKEEEKKEEVKEEVKEETSTVIDDETKEKISKAIELLHSFDSEAAIEILGEINGVGKVKDAMALVDEFEYEQAIAILKELV